MCSAMRPSTTKGVPKRRSLQLESTRSLHRAGGPGDRGTRHVQQDRRRQCAALGRELARPEHRRKPQLVEIGRVLVQQGMQRSAWMPSWDRIGREQADDRDRSSISPSRTDRSAGDPRGGGLRRTWTMSRSSPLAHSSASLAACAARSTCRAPPVVGVGGEQAAVPAFVSPWRCRAIASTLGVAVEECAQRSLQLRRRIDDERQALVHRLAAHLQRVRQRSEIDRRPPRWRLQEVEQVARFCGQLLGGARGQQRRPRDASAFAGGDGTGTTYSSTIKCAFEPPAPNDEMPAMRGTWPAVDHRRLPRAQRLVDDERRARRNRCAG